MTDLSHQPAAPGLDQTPGTDKDHAMRLDPGMPAVTTDGPCGELADVIIDPVHWQITHLVIEPHGRHDQARLVPISALSTCSDTLVLSWNSVKLHDARLVEDTDFVHLGAWPEPTDDWDIGVTRMLAWPYYPPQTGTGLTHGVGPNGGFSPGSMMATNFDRIPPGTAEIRRASEVVSSDDHCVGHVDGLIVEKDHGVTHIVLQRGHLWSHREITIPIDTVDFVRSDFVQLTATRAEIGSFPSVPFHRHPTKRSGPAERIDPPHQR